jgi:hypothetical protein
VRKIELIAANHSTGFRWQRLKIFQFAEYIDVHFELRQVGHQSPAATGTELQFSGAVREAGAKRVRQIHIVVYPQERRGRDRV